MNLRTIPGTPVEVSPVCLGTMTFGRPVRRPDAIKLVHRALEAGINFIDTANMYEGYDRSAGSAGGVAEEILGEALRGRRGRAVLISKVGNAVGPGPDDAGLGRKHVVREIDRSLQRLKTDHVDFYLAHRPDPQTPVEEMVETFSGLVRAGKTRFWGVSNFSGEEIERMAAVATDCGFDAPRLSQPHYSLLNRDAEKDHLPACRRNGIGVVCYRALEGGLLCGKYRRGETPPAGSRAQEKPEWLNLRAVEPTVFARVELVCSMAKDAGTTPAAYAIAWAIAQDGVTAAIVGVKNDRQLADAIAAAELSLTPAELLRLDETPGENAGGNS